MEKTKTLGQTIKTNPLPWITVTGSALLFVGNLYMASLLFPLVRNIDSIVSRVNAIEVEVSDREPLVERFLQLEERDKTLVEDIKEIKEAIKDLSRVHGI